MGNRFNEEKPFALYDPEQDRERQRQAPRNWSAPPVSARGAAQQYPQGPEPGYNRPGLSTPLPREQPFGRYDPELDRERPRQGMSNSYSSGPPSRPLDSLGMPQGAPQSSGRGVAPEPGYAAAGRGAPGAGLYPPQSNPGFAGRGGRYGDPDYGDGEDGYPSARPEMPGRGASLGRGRGGGGYGDPAFEVNGKNARYGDGEDGYPVARSEMLGRGAPLGRGCGGGYRDPAYDGDVYGKNPMYEEKGYPVTRPEFASVSRRGRGGGGFEDPAYDAHGNKPAYRDGDSGYLVARPEMLGRGAPLARGRGGGYRDPAYDDDAHGNNPRYGEDGYPVTRPEFASVSGRGRGGYEDAASGGNRNKPVYGDGESGYAGARPVRMPGQRAPFGRGRDSAVPPMGDGRYVYGGLRQLERLDLEEEYDAPPAPISSEYAHQVYASVFSDPVYGGAGQVNARAGYLEQPDDLRQDRHREDVLRHPDQY